MYCREGNYGKDGVLGTQSRVTLRFLNPAGAKTGKAMPAAYTADVLELPDGPKIEAPLVDVSDPGVLSGGRSTIGDGQS
jgi:2-methylaconitate cis-trans-isomerase PrpF